jgi:hypothetical protein
MNNADSRAQQVITINKLSLLETGTYNPMFSRPYKTHLDAYNMDSISRRVQSVANETGSGLVTGALISGIAGGMVRPSATPYAELSIPLGWTERRIRFIMEVGVTPSLGSPFIYYIQGYTSHLGITPTGNIDPRMEFIINSFIRVNRRQEYTSYGLEYKDVITESAHIVNGNFDYNKDYTYGSHTDHDIFKMRPSDIFLGVQSSYLSNAYNYTNDSANGLKDTRITLNREPIRSSRSNNIPSSYMAKIIDSYQHSNELTDFGASPQDVISRSMAYSNEDHAQNNIFIRAMMNIKGVQDGTRFTIKDLEKLDNDVSRVTNYITLGNTINNNLHQTGQTSYWNGSDQDTLVATVLTNAIPALMMDLMLTKVWFRSTNHDIGGAVTTTLIDYNSLTNADLTNNFQLFKYRLEKEVLYDVTYGNQETFSIEVIADLFGETTITLSLNSGPAITYTTPSFSDSLMTPVLTSDKTEYYGLVNDFESLINNLNEDTNIVPFGINNNI